MMQSIIAKLNSAADWAIVGGASTFAFILDGAMDVAPAAFFTPGMCALAAAGASLSAKRSIDAIFEARADARRRSKLLKEGNRLLKDLSSLGQGQAYNDLAWQLDYCDGDVEKLDRIVHDARAFVNKELIASQSRFANVYVRGGMPPGRSPLWTPADRR